MTRARQKLDSVVASPATAQAWNLEAIGEFKLHSRLVAATQAVASKRLAALSASDLLSSETARLLPITSTLEHISAREMEKTLTPLPTMRPEHRRVAGSPVQRNLFMLPWLADHLRVTALGLADPVTSPFLRGFPISGPIPTTGLWPRVRKLSKTESSVLLSNPVAVWPVAPPVPWEDPKVILEGWKTTKASVLPLLYECPPA